MWLSVLLGVGGILYMFYLVFGVEFWNVGRLKDLLGYCVVCFEVNCSMVLVMVIVFMFLLRYFCMFLMICSEEM